MGAPPNIPFRPTPRNRCSPTCLTVLHPKKGARLSQAENPKRVLVRRPVEGFFLWPKRPVERRPIEFLETIPAHDSLQDTQKYDCLKKLPKHLLTTSLIQSSREVQDEYDDEYAGASFAEETQEL